MTSIASTYRVSFAIGGEHAAKGVVDALTEIFFEGQAAIAAFERPDGRWDVTVHFAEPPDQRLVRELVANAAGRDIAEGIVFDTVEAKDWVKASLEDLVPVPAGRFIVHGQHDRDRIAPNKIGIEIEAALAFGTGHHGTTATCLELLESLVAAEGPARALDLGTGSGILAIAAARLGVGEVLACDSDPDAIAAAEANARRNGVGDRVRAVVDDVATLAAPPAPLVLANLLAAAHRAFAARYTALVTPGGVLVAGGLLDAEADDVAAALAAHGFRREAARSLEGWTSLALRHAALHTSA